jgi:glycosyltransferase involved in cell wall biosynthesis
MKTNDKQPLVSIVIPVYNGGEYFETCLQSVLDQTYDNWECIVNNNQSTDGSLEIADRFASGDSRFKVFTTDSFLKMVDNWNDGCKRISPESEYLKVVGADDWLFPESIEKMVEVMHPHPEVGLCSSYRLENLKVDMDGLNIWDGNVYPGKEILEKQIRRELDISGSNTTILFSVAHLRKLPRFPLVFDDTAYHQDTELVYEMMEISDVGFVFQVLTFTRRHEDSHTTKEGLRFRTLLQLNEKVLWKYKGDDRDLNRKYRSIRREYAAFMLKRRITMDRKAVNWHKAYIVRPFKFHEYFLGILIYNRISGIIVRILNKFVSLIR